MRTARAFIVSPSMLVGGGVSVLGGLLQGGVCLQGVSAPGGVCVYSGGICSQGVSTLGVSAPRGCLLGGGMPACTETDTPPVNRITQACENITLPQLRCGR